MSEVNYEMTWKFLKKLVGQFKKAKSRTAKDKTVSALGRNYAKGAATMAEIVLEEMECMEEGIAEFMKGEKADE